MMETSKLTLYVLLPYYLKIFTYKIPEYSTERHQHQCIKNLSHILEAADSDIMKVLMVKVFLSDMDNFAEMNSIYIQYRGDVKPCRTCVSSYPLYLYNTYVN